MRVTNIDIANVLGVQEAAVVAQRPVLFFAGSNGAGKSSMAEAVRLALAGEKSRGVDHKKDLGQLLHGEAPSGCVEVAFTDGAASYVLPQGSHSRPSFLDHEALPYVVEPSRFAGLDAQGRRGLLLKVGGVEITRATVRNRLAGRKCNEEKAAQVTPLLAAGFDAAQKEAQGKAREAKASWRTITGEAYGSNKAEGWAAPVPDGVDADAMAAAEAAVAQLDDGIEEANQALGVAQAAVAEAGNAARRRAELQEKAGKRERIVAKLEIDRVSLTEAEARVAAAKAAAAAPTTYPCPDCGVLLVLKDGALVHAEPGEAGDKEAAAKLPAYEKALTLCRSMVQNDERDLAAADAAADELAKLGDPVAAADEAAVLAAKSKVEQLKNERRGAHERLQKLREAQRQGADAANKTAQATKYHRDVQEWEAIADALAPDGIPAEFLAEALVPFNAALQAASELAGWPVVQIADDMTITMGGRAYRFRSESEKWRADALIAYCIAARTGLNFLMLDRFDVLDSKGRSEALYWINDLADAGICALVFGTLKALPAALPENIQGEWINDGKVLSAAA